jgi:hypothetical protein
MKKAFLGLLLLVVFAGSNFRSITSSSAAVSGMTIQTVAIVITDDPQNQIITVPETVHVGFKDRIQWVVVDIRKQGAQLSSVAVGDFVNKQTLVADSPFGNDSEYRLGPIPISDLGTKLSKEPMKQGTFKYNVTVLFSGQTAPVVLDPEIQVDGGSGGGG